MNLVELVEANKRGRSIRELMQDSGGYISGRNFFMTPYLKGIKSFPSADKIRGLAVALEVSPLAVVLAVAEQFGFGRSEVDTEDDPALQGAQARAERIKAELDAEREQIRLLKKRLSNMKHLATRAAPEPVTEPSGDDGESDYWREHALRYRARLARYEGLRPLPRKARNHLHSKAG